MNNFAGGGIFVTFIPSMIRPIELGSQVAVLTERSASVASQIRIEIRTEVLCNCDSISRVHSLDFEYQVFYAIHCTLDKIKVKSKFLTGSVTHGVSRKGYPTLD